MGILDGIVEWIAEQVMYGLDLINTSVLGALGCDMSVFLRYFPAAETMYEIFVALAIGLILLIWIAIHYDAPDAMRFETLNTHYTLLLGPAPQTAANPTMLMPVAA